MSDIEIAFLNIRCHCGSTASLKSNALIYNGKEYGNGKAWICDNFPNCRGSVGTHPDGRPLGTIPDEETKKLRIKIHSIIDPIWRNSEKGRKRKRKRGSVYGWLRRITGKEFHAAQCSKEDCLKILDLIKKNPYKEKKL